MVNLFVVITEYLIQYLWIGRKSGQCSPYILCLWLIGNGSLPMSVLYYEFPDNMLRYYIVFKYDVTTKAYKFQYTCPKIHVRLIWGGCSLISGYRSECFPLKYILNVDKLSDAIFNNFYLSHPAQISHVSVLCFQIRRVLRWIRIISLTNWL